VLPKPGASRKSSEASREAQSRVSRCASSPDVLPGAAGGGSDRDLKGGGGLV